jgi:GAF domain-containing protein
MNRKGKTKKQLYDELTALHKRVAELEAANVEQQRAEQAHRREVERLQVIRGIEEAALADQPLEAVARLGLDHLKRLVPYQGARIALFDFEARQAKVLAAEGEAGPPPGKSGAFERAEAESSSTPEPSETAVPEDGADFPLGSKIVQVLRTEGIPSYVGVPLVAGGAAIGILNVWAASSNTFALEHIQAIHELAKILADTFQHVSTHEQLYRHARELVALYNAAQAMVSDLDLQSALKTVIAEAKTLLGAEVASVLLPSGDTLVFEASVGPGSEALVGMQIPMTAGIAGWVMREKRAIRVNDAQHDPRFYPAVDQTTGLTTRSVLAVPLIAKGILSGVIEVINKAEPARPNSIFYEQDLEILMAMAGPAAIAIENARSYQAKVRQFERLKARLSRPV